MKYIHYYVDDYEVVYEMMILRIDHKLYENINYKLYYLFLNVLEYYKG